MNPYQPPNPQQQQYQQYPQQQYYPQPGYEFTETENKVLNAAATWAMILGIIEILEGAAQLAQKSHSNLNLIVHVVMGVMLIVASQSLKKVTSTQGQDVPHLMKALDNFSNVLLIRIILLCLALVIIVFVVVALFALIQAIK
jgi:hypothetical protein